MEKYGRVRQTTDDNMARAHCMLDTYVYKQTLRICNTYCLSTTTMVARRRPNVTLYVHGLSCLVVLNFRVMLPELVSIKVGPRAKRCGDGRWMKLAQDCF